MLTNDFSKFEEHILNYIKEIESKIIFKINKKNSEINESINNFDSKINEIIQNIESVKETLIENNIYKNKLKEFESFKNKADNMLISHEIRTQSYNADINSLKEKYEKIIIENLNVPGYIGASCKYKNLSDYLLNNMIELNKIKADKEDRKKDIKEIKSKFDNIMKSMISLNDGSIERCKDYTNHIQKDIINYVENKLKDSEDKAFQIKTEIYKYNSINEQKIMEMNQKVSQMKKELNESINEKIGKIKNNQYLLQDNIEIILNNIEKHTKEIDDIKNNINEIDINLKENIINLKKLTNSYSILKNNIKDIQEKHKNEANIQKNNIQRGILKNEINKNLTNENSKSNKKFIEKNNINEKNNNKKGNIILKGLDSSIYKSDNKLKDKSIKYNLRNNKAKSDIDNENENESYKENDNDENSYIYNNKSKSNKAFSSNDSSLEKSSKSKKINNDINNQNCSNKNFNMYKVDNIYKNKTLSTNVNKYFKREAINAKSITSLIREEKSPIKKELIDKYKPKQIYRNYNTEKDIAPQIGKYINLKTEKKLGDNNIYKINSREREKGKEKEKEKEKEERSIINSKNEKNEKIKLNYELINNIHKNKVLDLYSFSTSPPEGRFNLNILTIDDTLPKKLLKKQKLFEIQKDVEVNSKVSQTGMNINKNIKNIKSQSSIQNNKNKYQNIKNRNRLSSERISFKNMKNYFPIKNSSIIDIPPKFNFPFNKTFLGNEHYKDKNNLDIKIRNTMKELKLADNFQYLTSK